MSPRGAGKLAIHCDITKEEAEKLHVIERKLDRARAYVIRIAIQEFIAKYGEKPPDKN